MVAAEGIHCTVQAVEEARGIRLVGAGDDTLAGIHGSHVVEAGACSLGPWLPSVAVVAELEPVQRAEMFSPDRPMVREAVVAVLRFDRSSQAEEGRF